MNGSAIGFVVGFGVAVLLIVALTRGRLGYWRYLQEEDPDPATAPA